MTARVLNPDELTPCEQYGGTWYKRDDLFMPFDDVPVSGGKVRHVMKLLGPLASDIHKRHDGIVLSATGVHSPFGLILARVAREYALRTVLFVGATTEQSVLSKHAMLRTATRFGATLDTSARVAYEAALVSALHRWQRAHGGRGYWVKRFAIDAREYAHALLHGTAAQVQNVPREVDTLVVPVGAGITAAAIMLGLRLHAPWVTRVVLVQIAGYDRRDEVDALLRGLQSVRRYDWHVSKRYAYAHQLRRSVAPGFTLDPLYEAKAHEHMTDVLHLGGPRVLFWCVGNSSFVRESRKKVSRAKKSARVC